MWTGEKKRFVAIHDVCNKLGASACNLLPFIHSIIQSNSTTSFAGIVKKKALKRINENIDGFADLINESACLDVSCDKVVDAVEFICLLCDRISNCC